MNKGDLVRVGNDLAPHAKKIYGIFRKDPATSDRRWSPVYVFNYFGILLEADCKIEDRYCLYSLICFPQIGKNLYVNQRYVFGKDAL